ncbi:hypothetical protein CIT292_09832 [Citrobacter youngae ATCC 29220]|uniref:Uncharacterized protein n=1 Tax=Citrobacter youngae ATCC 29220 TaxID=500640 RepID=D4BH25_9ENTR|nr:hypothetical protein CIT292_09832 [Citrobacter youngae ATCC 29220]
MKALNSDDPQVFPAPAGINRVLCCYIVRKRSVPRASGDKPVACTSSLISSLCSPRQRG